jgi:hypothetical protein
LEVVERNSPIINETTIPKPMSDLLPASIQKLKKKLKKLLFTAYCLPGLGAGYCMFKP